jgi:hypothetical protein
MTILESVWFGPIGIVKVRLDGEIRFFIGIGRGWDQKMDERHISEWGNSFNPNDPFFNIEEYGRTVPSPAPEQ